MHFASANHSQGRELFQPIELQYSVLATWWKYREPSVKIHYCHKEVGASLCENLKLKTSQIIITRHLDPIKASPE